MSELMFGRNTVKAVLDTRELSQIESVLVQEGSLELVKLVSSYHITPKMVTKDKLNNVCHNGNHQGIACYVASYKTYSLKELMDAIKDKSHALIVALDNLEDPHNLGAILRTCEASGVSGIIYPKNHSVSLNATVAKVSTGAIEVVPCCEVTNLTQAIKALKKEGFWVYGAEHDESSLRYDQVRYDSATVLVLGSEGKGISRLVSEECDYHISIPMVGMINSLNVSVAAGLLIYEIRRSQGAFDQHKS